MYRRSLKLCMIATTLSSVLSCQFWVILIKVGHNNGRQLQKWKVLVFPDKFLSITRVKLDAFMPVLMIISHFQCDRRVWTIKRVYIFIVSHLNICSTSLDCCSMSMSMKMLSFLLLLKYCSAVCCLCLIQYVWHVNAYSVLLHMWFIYVCVLTSVRRRKH